MRPSQPELPMMPPLLEEVRDSDSMVCSSMWKTALKPRKQSLRNSPCSAISFPYSYSSEESKQLPHKFEESEFIFMTPKPPSDQSLYMIISPHDHRRFIAELMMPDLYQPNENVKVPTLTLKPRSKTSTRHCNRSDIISSSQ